MPRQRNPGETRTTMRLDEALLNQVQVIAKERGITVKALVEQALRTEVQVELADRVDASLAPLINQVIEERHAQLGKSLRTLIVRLAYEVLRTQAVLYNFMTQAGIPESRIDSWHEEGWRYATREFKNQPKVAADDTA